MSYFSNRAFTFLKELEANNQRDWFKENEARFESEVRGPALAFIEDAAGWLEVAGHPYRGVARKSGGSLSRIHRDTRFSNDKTPYHTHMTLHFSHAEGSKTKPMPMIGIRWSADGDVGMGGGIYGGDTPTLNKIRDAIVADEAGWIAAKGGLELWGDSLKTAPKGYDKEHPLIEDIRRKSFMASAPLSRKEFTGDLMPLFQNGVEMLAPFGSFLADALE